MIIFENENNSVLINPNSFKEFFRGLYIKADGVNSEGAMIDFIHSKRKDVDYLIINPGALTHYSYALRDAIIATQLKTIEVHLSDIHNRENFRKISVIKSVCLAQYYGEGKQGYLTAIKHILEKE